MKSIKSLVLTVAVIGLVIAWYLFRPELLWIDSHVSEQLPTTPEQDGVRQPLMLASGRFHSVAHQTTGTATIYQLAGQSRVLRLSNFSTSNGPAVYVYLVALPDAGDDSAVLAADKVNLGPLKGNVGDQNYELPANIDLTRFRAVTIWCQRFGVNFATAPLALQFASNEN